MLGLTYCPLTGSPVAYTAEPGGRGRGRASFGVSGLLYNSNLVMYDHETDSLWPQLLGASVRGPRQGERLRTESMVTTTWGRWKAFYPETDILV